FKPWVSLPGVTVCLMTLVSLQPASVGDTLLLTRLEKGSAPVTIRIPTGCSKAPLSSVLREFDGIQREQKESINCTDHVEWWQCRLKLDQRMKSLIETLETQVLGCWKGALLPGSPEPGLAEEVSALRARLQQRVGTP
ncbi:ESPL1 protein, partial [Crypturellus undulatus]|nr:ESPL1 protein [Crypturellus undulatus]